MKLESSDVLKPADRLGYLKKRLAYTEKAAATHLRETTLLTKRIEQHEAVEHAKDHLLKPRNLDATSNDGQIHKKRKAQMDVSKEMLLRIDNISELGSTHSYEVQNLFNLYNDDNLLRLFEMILLKGKEGSDSKGSGGSSGDVSGVVSGQYTIDSKTFGYFTSVISDGRITRIEGAQLYMSSKQQFDRLTAAHDGNFKFAWDEFLMRRLRSRVMLTYIANKMGDIGLTRDATEIFSRNAPSDAGSMSPRRTKASNQVSSPSANSVKVSSSAGNGRTKYVSMASPKPVHKQKSSSLSGQSMAKEVLSEFDDSISSQVSHTNHLINRLSAISQTVPIDKNNYNAAFDFSRRLAVRKMESILIHIANKVKVKAITKWRRGIDTINRVTQVKSSLDLLLCCKLVWYFQVLFERKVKRFFSMMYRNIQIAREEEILCAIADVQRTWRGSLIRKRIHQKLRKYCANLIQTVVRGCLGRLKYKRISQKRLELYAARKIEQSYQKYKWKRIRRNLRIFKQQKAMVIRIQRMYKNYYFRKKALQVSRQLKFHKRATILQKVWRGSEGRVKAAKKRIFTIKTLAAICIQRRVRGIKTRVITNEMLFVFRSARTMQCCIRCYMARRRRQKKFNRKCVIKIQRQVRRMLSTARVKVLREIAYKLLTRRTVAIHTLAPMLLGHFVRQKYTEAIKSNTVLRRETAATVQRYSRGFLSRYRVLKIRQAITRRLEDERIARETQAIYLAKCKYAAIEIQRCMRGRLGRRRFANLWADREDPSRTFTSYYKMKHDYLRDQNLFHRGFILKIQCAYRFHRARLVLIQKRVERKRLEALIRWGTYGHKLYVRGAVNVLTNIAHKRQASALLIQRMGRGMIGRHEYSKHEKTEILKWFIEELSSLGMIGKVLQNFRVRRRTEERLISQIMALQALVRGYCARCYFLRSYKRLMRERDRRIKKRRIKAATVIQGFARIIRAHNEVIKRKIVIVEEEKKKAIAEELDNKIDGIHTDWMTDLQATRIETEVRGMLSKSHAEKRRAEVAQEMEEKKVKNRALNATKIQALMRGAKCRMEHEKNIPRLREEKKKRTFCVECELNPSTKRCRDCKDRYCEACYILIHRKGARRHHSWVHITPEFLTEMATHAKSKKAGADRRGANMQKTKAEASELSPIKKSRSDWEKFRDEAANAYYWYNAKTGEASWTDPEG